MEKTTVVIMGHVGHGKTAFTSDDQGLILQGLTDFKDQEDIEKIAEGKSSDGISIGDYQIEYKKENRSYGITYLLGHVDVVKYIHYYSKRIVAAVLVVSGEEGLTPYSREQIRMASEYGIPKVFVFINVFGEEEEEEENLELIETEIEELLSDYEYAVDENTICRGSVREVLENDDLTNNSASQIQLIIQEQEKLKLDTPEDF